MPVNHFHHQTHRSLEPIVGFLGQTVRSSQCIYSSTVDYSPDIFFAHVAKKSTGAAVVKFLNIGKTFFRLQALHPLLIYFNAGDLGLSVSAGKRTRIALLNKNYLRLAIQARIYTSHLYLFSVFGPCHLILIEGCTTHTLPRSELSIH